MFDKLRGMLKSPSSNPTPVSKAGSPPPAAPQADASARAPPPAHAQTIIFAAGCFWGVEELFRRQPGVVATRTGYTGGHSPNPTYEQVCAHTTGHAEAVEVVFDPAQVPLSKLLDLFWENHDPTTPDRQGNDVGDQYRSAIFYTTEGQKKEAMASKAALEKSGKFKRPIVTHIEKAGVFWEAEEYHQKYLVKNPGGYCHIKF